MASRSGGSGADGSAERAAAAAANDLIEARDGAERLKSLLQAQEEGAESGPWTVLMDGMLNNLSSALSALETGGTAAPAAAGGQNAARRPVTPSGRNNTRKRSMISTRSRGPSSERVAATLDDGHVWRKYGQKEIQNSLHPRSYYRCTHKSDQGCNAKKHVQLCEADPSKFVVTYYGEHTCRDPSTIPMVIVDGTSAGAASDRPSNLISFAPGYSNSSRAAAAAAITTSSFHFAKEAMMMMSTTQQLTSSWCTSDDAAAEPFVQVDDLAAVVGSAPDCRGVADMAGGGAGSMPSSSTVGSAPGYCGLADMAGGGGGAGSLPSSPSSPAGFLGTVDDDLFWFDP